MCNDKMSSFKKSWILVILKFGSRIFINDEVYQYNTEDYKSIADEVEAQFQKNLDVIKFTLIDGHSVNHIFINTRRCELSYKFFQLDSDIEKMLITSSTLNLRFEINSLDSQYAEVKERVMLSEKIYLVKRENEFLCTPKVETDMEVICRFPLRRYKDLLTLIEEKSGSQTDWSISTIRMTPKSKAFGS